ncbi:hypothetical conserved protein [Candidatus Nitrosoglobus terrae]|uniref:Hypothetical conserved protein n=1 Tax=Candidatus Nitrosoglobus terrae TaxID=1630141 RepID=A0A1Q2SPH4_9GAMM|nr:hypothetical conserved protein [Candidatus Nitrosoglobus terrae]
MEGEKIARTEVFTKTPDQVSDLRNYTITLVVFISIAANLHLDANSTLAFQNILGILAWIFLLGFLRGESNLVRSQVLIAVAFATIGEHFASVYMEGYIYRFHNVPAYVPPGHGLVYLTAVALARSSLFRLNLKIIRNIVLMAGGGWSIWGLTGATQEDILGALLFVIFIFSVYFGRSPGVYLGAFFVTTWLELIGVSHGTWRWVSYEPILQLTQGNPPSGVAAWYCLVDAVALRFAPNIIIGFNWIQATWRK